MRLVEERKAYSKTQLGTLALWASGHHHSLEMSNGSSGHIMESEGSDRLFILSWHGDQAEHIRSWEVRQQAACGAMPSLSVWFTVWKRAVSSLLTSSTRIVDLLWVMFPMSFHLCRRNPTVFAQRLSRHLWQYRRVICYYWASLYKWWFSCSFKS